MTEDTQWNNVEVLIPRRFRAAQEAAMSKLRVDLASLMTVLPPAAPNTPLATFLANANLQEGREWLASVIRALPTQADMEAGHGIA